MQLLFHSKISRALLASTATAIVSGLSLAGVALAQDAPVNSDPQTAAPGHIIYSRDVPYGSAIGPRTPGHAHTVNAGPTTLILDSIGTGLQPIGDDENASIVAGTNFYVGQTGGQVAQGMSALASMTGAGGSASTVSDVHTSSTGGAINRATGAIGSAMGNLNGVLSDSQSATRAGGGQ